MPVYRLGPDLIFPPPEVAEPDGILAVGGDLRPERLLLAYSQGIFPWYDEKLPIIWHSPDPRMVLMAEDLHVPHSLRKAMRRRPYELALDTAFAKVIRACAQVPRPGQDGTWITDDMIEAYEELHRQGFAHSVEAWEDGELVGGLYGVSLGHCFFGESMFTLRSDASKIAFVSLVEQLERWRIDLIDCQVHTEHLERFGAVEWPRARFLDRLAERLEHETRQGRWAFDEMPAESSRAKGEEPIHGD
ncbi:MAG: leucyl/phenylalanyl-tRNA--protein transferase [Myxococcota bacterium]